MSKSAQIVSKTLILPAIGSYQYLPSVDPGLLKADGTALRPYINTIDKDLSFSINGDGTIDIYNVSGTNLASGKTIVVTSIEDRFNVVENSQEVVSVAPVATPFYPVSPMLLMSARATDNQVFSNVETNILFGGTSSSLPITAQGFIDPPGSNGGAFVVRKPGLYLFSGSLVFSATSGGGGAINVRMVANGTVTYTTWSRSVDVASGFRDRSLPLSYLQFVTPAALESNGGIRTFEFKIATTDAAIAGKMGGSATTTTQSSSMNVSYIPDYFTAA